MADLEKVIELVHRSEITHRLERVPSNPILAADSQEEGLEHYRCRLSKGDKRLDVFVSLRSGDSPLSLADVLLLLALDACGCDFMGSIEKYHTKWEAVFGATENQPKDIQYFWKEYAGRCEQTERLRDFLGPAQYREVLDLFELEQS
jgi:hypothetical protein